MANRGQCRKPAGWNMVEQLKVGGLYPAEIAGTIEAILAMPPADRRSEQRVPYFAPVAISLEENPGVSLSAFSKDISLSGIGLVHVMPIKAGPVQVALTLPSGRTVKLLTEIMWCRHHGNGWYTSGGRFVEAS